MLRKIKEVLDSPSGIVMVFSKTIPQAVENYKLFVKTFGSSVVDMFHGRNTDRKKQTVFDRMKEGKCRLIACTSAMGVVSILTRHSLFVFDC